MNRPYTAHSPYSLTPTERIPSVHRTTAAGETRRLTARYRTRASSDVRGLRATIDEYDDTQPIDRRWMWIAGVAGAILFVAVIATGVILGGGDSGSVSTTVARRRRHQPAATTSAPPAATTPSAPPPAAPLPPETVTTVPADRERPAQRGPDRGGTAAGTARHDHLHA